MQDQLFYKLRAGLSGEFLMQYSESHPNKSRLKRRPKKYVKYSNTSSHKLANDYHSLRRQANIFSKNTK